MSCYLDNAATSFPKAPGVEAAMARYINQIGANVSRSTYHSATDAGLVVLETRERLRTLFHFTQPVHQVTFFPGATWGLNQILRGYLQPGDHVLVSSLEHNAVMRPLSDLAKAGVTFSRIPANEKGLTRAEDMGPLIRPNTKLVMVSHASNVCGSILPLTEIAAICREKSIPLAVDGAQSAGHLDIDFDALHLAALCVPGHKGLAGPQGVGALLLDKAFAQALTPLVTGGTGSASDSEIQPDYLPDKFESGTMNLPGIFGLHGALEYVLDTGIDVLHAREAALTRLLLEGLASLPVQVIGPNDPARQVGVVSLDFPGRDNGETAYRLETEYGLLTRCGLHCAPNAHKTLGTFPRGTVRLSLGHFSTEADVELALRAVAGVCR